MNSKRWIKLWSLLSTSILAFGTINYIIDPYGLNGIVNIQYFNTNKLPNTSIATRVKTAIIQKGGFDTILLGTSRVGVIDPDEVNKQLNTHTLNLEYPASLTPIQKDLFFYALKYNNIKNLIYAIDFLSFNKSRTVKGDFQEFFGFQEKVKNKENIYNFDLYFNLQTFSKSLQTLRINTKTVIPQESVYLMRNGMRDYINHIYALKHHTYNLEENINKSIEHYFQKDAGEYQNYKFSYEYLKDFEEIISFCKLNDIKIWVYISPMYSKHYDAIYEHGYGKEFDLFKYELKKITTYTDFTGHTSISTNKNNYWDSSHLKKELSKKIITDIFSDKKQFSQIVEQTKETDY